MKFETNIKCGACVATVTPALDQLLGAGQWQVDLTAAERVLSVQNDGVTAEMVQQALLTVGYQAKPLAS